MQSEVLLINNNNINANSGATYVSIKSKTLDKTIKSKTLDKTIKSKTFDGALDSVEHFLWTLK